MAKKRRALRCLRKETEWHRTVTVVGTSWAWEGLASALEVDAVAFGKEAVRVVLGDNLLQTLGVWPIEPVGL